MEKCMLFRIFFLIHTNLVLLMPFTSIFCGSTNLFVTKHVLKERHPLATVANQENFLVPAQIYHKILELLRLDL